MSKPIRVGTIGLGQIARGVHLPGTMASEDLQLMAVCDIDDSTLQKVGDQYGVDPAYRFKNYRDLIACPEVDAVDICTPNDLHYEMAMAAVEAGKPYACEKPAAMCKEEADTLAARTKERNLPGMVCFSYRFKAAARYARDIIRRGLLGDIYHADMQYFQAWGLPDAHCPLVWRYQKDRAGSGALGDLGCHALDLVRFVLDKEYVKVVSHAGTYVKQREKLDGSGLGDVDVDDFCNYLAQMEDGISASFQITRFGFGRGNYQRLELYGSKGSLVYKLDEAPGVDELEVCINQPAGETNTFTPIRIPEHFRKDQMQAFADLINGCGDGTPATIEDGRSNQHMVDAVIQSFEEERWIYL